MGLKINFVGLLIYWGYFYASVVFCDETCDPLYIKENKSISLCILNQRLNEPSFSDYKEGDYFEVFEVHNNQSWTLISIKSRSGEGHNGERQESCFICISCYNVSTGEFEKQDQLILDFENPKSSSNGIWESKLDSSASQQSNLNIYDIGSKSGTHIFMSKLYQKCTPMNLSVFYKKIY